MFPHVCTKHTTVRAIRPECIRGWKSDRPQTYRRRVQTRAEPDGGPNPKPAELEGASTDLDVIYQRLVKLVKPFWVDNLDRKQPLLALGGVVVLSLMTTGVSVVFSFLGRDFFNALSSKNEAEFYSQLVKYLCGFAVGIPVFVFRDYFLGLLTLRWRAWMTEDLLDSYMGDRTFYNIHTGAVVDNPDQRLTSDINQFTASSLSLAFTFLTSAVDLVSFSGILFTIYPPLFIALSVYAVGGTVAAFYIGRKLVGLNFAQEANEADFRYGLVRVRENAESIAFYSGSSSEVGLLLGRLGKVVGNYRSLLTASRNLDFFQSAYRYIIILLPAAVVAPLYFEGKIEFGVVSQSQSAFSHILSDVSLVVYQFESLAGFSAVVDRLGQFQEAIEAKGKLRLSGDSDYALDPESKISFVDTENTGKTVVSLDKLTIATPNYLSLLVQSLDLDVEAGSSVLVMGPSGCGKTSLLRAIGGLWDSGQGSITRPGPDEVMGNSSEARGMMLVPQKPYMALGTLRQQLLYPVFDAAIISEAMDGNEDNFSKSGFLDFPIESHPAATQINGKAPKNGNGAAAENGTADKEGSVNGNGNQEAAEGNGNGNGKRQRVEQIPAPPDEVLLECLKTVGLEQFLERSKGSVEDDPEKEVLDIVADWSTQMSLGEQQRLAFARVLLANPALVLLDESTSALDTTNESKLYSILQDQKMTYISVGHRDSLRQFHNTVLDMTESTQQKQGAGAA